MTRHTLACMLMLGLAVPAYAAERAWEQSFAATCSPFLMDFECREHLQTMAELHDPQAREVYLRQHLALLEERRQSCACAQTHNEIGLLRY
jgi:hypothetical protein